MIPGGWEWIIIIVVVVLLFGARRLPEMGKSLGQGIRGFRKELRGEDEKNQSDETTDEQDKKSGSTKSE